MMFELRGEQRVHTPVNVTIRIDELANAKPMNAPLLKVPVLLSHQSNHLVSTARATRLFSESVLCRQRVRRR